MPLYFVNKLYNTRRVDFKSKFTISVNKKYTVTSVELLGFYNYHRVTNNRANLLGEL